MDTFFEQIVPIKKTAKDFFALVGIWVLAGVLAFFAFGFLSGLFIFALTVVGLIFYGAFRLSKMLFIEYEYIVTNGTIDIDKIIAKSSRKRVMSFEISGVNEIEKYNPNKRLNQGEAKPVIACNINDPNAFRLHISKDGKGKQVLVFAPDDRIKEEIVKSLPKYIANSAFK